MADDVLRLEQVRKSYNIGRPTETEILHGIDLSVDDGEFVVFVGPSGCGKSTLLRLVAGLEPPRAGVVREDGGAISLQLFGASFAAIVYRVLDEDTLAVSVTELPTPAEGERAASLAARDKAVANVQHGYMFRVA